MKPQFFLFFVFSFSLLSMASTSAIPPVFSLLIENNQRRSRSCSVVEYSYSSSQQRIRNNNSSSRSSCCSRNRKRSHVLVLALAGNGDTEMGPSPPKPEPGTDTRIHWGNEEEGWLGVGGGDSTDKSTKKEQILGDSNLRFPDLLNSSTDSHYQFLGITAEADLEEIKSAYRRLSKEYHPDTTSLPLKSASEKFMKLREIYDVLSDEETRKFYDWTLAQEVAARQEEKLKIKLEDPFDQELRNYKSIPDMVDRLGGRNMPLSDQALSALTIDLGIIAFAICSFIYVLFFKEPN